MPELTPELIAALLFTYGPFIGCAVVYFLYYIFWGRDKNIKAEADKQAAQIAAEREKLRMQLESEERRSLQQSDGLKALASAMDKHTDMDDRRFGELRFLSERQTGMLRELPGAIGEEMRLRDDSLSRSKEH